MIVSLEEKCLDFPAHLLPTLRQLVLAWNYAQDTESRIWDFAVRLDSLRGLGACENDIRWLVKKGIVQHGSEITLEGEEGRTFRATGSLTLTPNSCVVLTAFGFENAARFSDFSAVCAVPSASRETDSPCRSAHPDWHPESRKLILEGALVKRFKWPAMNQEAILCAFQEEGWPLRIDDPLPPQDDLESKRRLADTIKCLNRKQEHKLLHFRGDGTGEGVTWERVSPSKPLVSF